MDSVHAETHKLIWIYTGPKCQMLVFSLRGWFVLSWSSLILESRDKRKHQSPFNEPLKGKFNILRFRPEYGSKSTCASARYDQDPYCWFSDLKNVINFKWTVWILIMLRDCTKSILFAKCTMLVFSLRDSWLYHDLAVQSYVTNCDAFFVINMYQ